MIRAWLFFKLIQVDLKKIDCARKFDGGAVENWLDLTPEAQIDASWLEWPNSQVIQVMQPVK